jgi:hypothetical protein
MLIALLHYLLLGDDAVAPFCPRVAHIGSTYVKKL